MIDDVTLKIMTQHLGFVNCVLSNYFQTDRVCNIHGAMNVAYTAYLAASKTEQIFCILCKNVPGTICVRARVLAGNEARMGLGWARCVGGAGGDYQTQGWRPGRHRGGSDTGKPGVAVCGGNRGRGSEPG